MRPHPAFAPSLAVLAAAPATADQIQLTPNGSRPSTTGAAPMFTGAVVVDPLFSATERSAATGGLVTFAPGARTAWHARPAGQTLYALSRVGWHQEWGGPRREMRPGDVVRIPAGVKHWHGATATNEVRHVAVQDEVDGRNVDWGDPVSDGRYAR